MKEPEITSGARFGLWSACGVNFRHGWTDLYSIAVGRMCLTIWDFVRAEALKSGGFEALIGITIYPHCTE